MKMSQAAGDMTTATGSVVPSLGEPTRDGGCIGWLVVLGAHVCQLFVLGAYQAIGPLFVVIQRHFEETSARTSWIIALLASVAMGLGPLSNIFVKKTGFRMTVFIGTIISSTGYCVSAFAHEIEFLYLSIGLTVGFGYALIIPPSLSIIAYYIQKKFEVANAVATVASSLAVFIFPPLLQLLIDNYGWRGSVIVFSALNAQMGISAALFRAPEEEIRNEGTPEEGDDDAKRSPKCLTGTVEMCDFKLFARHPSFSVFTFASTVSLGLGYQSLAVHLLARAEDKRLGSSTDTSLIVSIFGLAGIVGRLVHPLILHFTKKCTRNINVYAFSLCFAGACNLMSPLATDYTSYIAYASLLGISAGIFLSMMTVILRDIVGTESMTAACGIVGSFLAIGSLIGPPCAGYIYDVTDDYDNSFYFYGCLLAFGGLMIFVLEPYTTRHRGTARKATNVTLGDPDGHRVYVAEMATQTGP